jgi:hypothetical protein
MLLGVLAAQLIGPKRSQYPPVILAGAAPVGSIARPVLDRQLEHSDL